MMHLVINLTPVFAFICSALAVPIITNGILTCVAAAGTLVDDLGMEAKIAPFDLANFAISTKLRIESDLVTGNMGDIKDAAGSVMSQSNSHASTFSGQTMSDAEATMNACQPSGMLPIVRRTIDDCFSTVKVLVGDLRQAAAGSDPATSKMMIGFADQLDVDIGNMDVADMKDTSFQLTLVASSWFGESHIFTDAGAAFTACTLS